MNEENILSNETEALLETETVSESYVSVSGGDAVALLPSVVSGSDLEASTTALALENETVVSQLEAVNYHLNALLFLILFIWVEERIRNAVGRFVNGKSD